MKIFQKSTPFAPTRNLLCETRHETEKQMLRTNQIIIPLPRFNPFPHRRNIVTVWKHKKTVILAAAALREEITTTCFIVISSPRRDAHKSITHIEWWRAHACIVYSKKKSALYCIWIVQSSILSCHRPSCAFLSREASRLHHHSIIKIISDYHICMCL